MLDPLTMSLILSGVKTGVGIYQGAQGNKLAKEAVRPTQEIPSAATAYLQNAQAQANNQRLPGQSALEANIQGNTAQTLRAGQESANNPAALMALASATNSNANNAMVNIGTEAAKMQRQNQLALGGAQQYYAGEQDKVFDYNKDQPYQQKLKAAMALKGAGIQNAYGGIENAAGSLMQNQTIQQQKDAQDAYLRSLLAMGGNSQVSPLTQQGSMLDYSNNPTIV